MVTSVSKVVKVRSTTKRTYMIKSLDDGFTMPVIGLKALRAMLDIVAVNGTFVKVTVVSSTVKGGV